MNQVFDFGRFWRFFRYDLIRTYRSSSTKLLSFIISPVCLFLLFGLVRMVFGFGWVNFGLATRFTAFAIMSAAFFIYYSSNIYGFLTEKKAGTSWLMIPASVTEKYITMILNVLVVAPTVYLVSALLLDWVYSTVFSDGSGSILAVIFSSNGLEGLAKSFDPIQVSRTSLYAMIQPSVWSPLLMFLLGGICFKRNKVAKTLLCYFAASIAFSFIIAGIINIFDGSTFATLIDWLDNPKHGEFMLNAVIFTMTAVPCIALAVAVFFRLKTIKH